MITFPRMMPSVAAMSQAFELDRVDLLSPEAGGRLGSITQGQPIWSTSISLTNMIEDDADIWRAWVLSMRGAGRHFYGFDIDRRLPKKHRGGFSGMVRAGTVTSFDGSASTWSETLDGENSSRLTLTGLPAGLTLSLGDYVGFKWDQAGYAAGNLKRRALVRVVEVGVASASGDLTVTSEPPVPIVVPVGAKAHLDDPLCLMKLVPETKLAEQGLGYTASGSRIVAVQDLRA